MDFLVGQNEEIGRGRIRVDRGLKKLGERD